MELLRLMGADMQTFRDICRAQHPKTALENLNWDSDTKGQLAWCKRS